MNTPVPPPPVAKKKRWKKVLTITGWSLLGMILLVILLAPPIIGSVAKSRIAAIMGERLQGEVTLDDVSFSWPCRLQVDGVRVVPRGFADPLLQIKKVDLHVSLGSALGGRVIADVEVVAPRVIVERGSDGKFNCEIAPAADKAGKEGDSDPAEKPFLQVGLKIRDGSVVIRSKGHETIYQALTVDARVDTLEKPIDYSLSLEGPEKDKLLVSGNFDLTTRSGAATVMLDRLSLRNLSKELEGTLTGMIELQSRGAPQFSGKARIEAVDVARLGRITLAYDGALDEKGGGKQILAITSGKAAGATITVDVTDGFNTCVATTDVKIDADLAALPGGMSLGGQMSVRGRTISRGSAPRFSAETDVRVIGTNLVVEVEGKPMTLERIDLRHAGTLDETGKGEGTITLESGKALQIESTVKVTNAFSGAPNVHAALKGNSDLGELGRALEKLIGLKQGLRLEGGATVLGTMDVRGAEGVTAGLQVAVADLVAVSADKKRTGIDKAINLALEGSWDAKKKSVTAEILKLDSSFATLNARGGAAPGEIRPSVVKIDADLEKLSTKLGLFMADPPLLGGRITVDATCAGERFTSNVSFKAVTMGAALGPVTATLVQEGTLSAGGKGDHTITLESGKALHLGATVKVTDAFGGAPNLHAAFKGNSDLGELGRTFGKLIGLKQGLQLEGAAVVSGTMEVLGAEGARAGLQLAVADLVAMDSNKKRTGIDKAIHLALEGSWDARKKSVTVELLKLDSSFVTLNAKGGAALDEIRPSMVKIDADLGKLSTKLGLFMTDAPLFGGRIAVDATYAGERFSSGVSLKAVTMGAALGPVTATLVQKGAFSGGGLRIEECKLTSNAVDARLSGEIRKVMEDGREGDLTLEVTARPVELSKWFRDLNLGGPEIALAGAASLKPGQITLTGRTKLDGLSRTTAAVTRTARTESVDFVVTMKDKAILATLKTAACEWIDKGYVAKGGLSMEIAYDDKGTSGITKLTNLVIVDDQKKEMKDPHVTVAHEIVLASAAMELRKLDVTSTFLSGSVTGKILNPGQEPEFQGIHASFKYFPDKLGAVLAPWLPGKLEGAGEKSLDIRLDGKAGAANLLSILRGVRGTAEVDLARFTMNGISVSGKTKVDLKEGRAVSATPLEVNQGRTELSAALDFREAEKNPRSTFDFRSKDVDANADMKPLLEAINPIFHTVNGTVAGRIQSDFKLVWDGKLDPAESDWAGSAARSLSGSGIFAMKELNIVGSPAFAEIMTALGEGNQLKGELLGTDIRIARGRCEYTNMTLRLARYELRFSGWVDFRKHMDLMVEMPMTEGMVRKYPGLEKYIGKTLFVPLRGKTDSPRLDFQKVITELLKRAAEGVIEDKAKKLLEDLLKKKKKKDK